MHLRKRKKTWYASVFVNGEWVEKSTRCSSRDAAERIAREWERQAADPDYAAQAKATLSDALELVVERTQSMVKAGKRSDSTVTFYEKKIGHWVRIFEIDSEGNHRPLQLARFRPADVDAFIDQRRDEGAGEHTIHKELVTLRLALKLAKRKGWWKGDIGEFIPVGFSPEYTPRQRHLTESEVKKLVAKLLPYQAARVAFIVATGAEWIATDRALRSDVAADLSSVRIRGSKNENRDRTVPIVLETCKAFLTYAMAHGESGDALFRTWTNVRRDLIDACEAAGIERCSPNDLRRTFGHWLRNAGVPLELIAPTLGHATTKMAQTVYAKPDAQELAALTKAAVRKVPVSTGHLPDTERNQVDPSDSVDEAKSDFVQEMVPRGGIEPPTRGFSVPAHLIPKPRKTKVQRNVGGRFAGYLPDETRPARVTKPRKRS
jgi:integrase